MQGSGSLPSIGAPLQELPRDDKVDVGEINLVHLTKDYKKLL